MTKNATAAVLITIFSAAAFTAQAAPGPKILTAGTTKERTAMTEGVSHNIVKGVNVFRGSPALLGAEKAAQDAPPSIELELIGALCACSEKSPRGLRTQGFYSGKVYSSRRYTQGFYSGN